MGGHGHASPMPTYKQDHKVRIFRVIIRKQFKIEGNNEENEMRIEMSLWVCVFVYMWL